MKTLTDPSWIWTEKQDDAPDIYRCFRCEFDVTAEDMKGDVDLLCAADSLFEIFLNGTRLPVTQCADVPGEKTMTRIEVKKYLHQGTNLIASRVHYLKTDFFTYCCGRPGFCAGLVTKDRCITETGPLWKCAPDPAYLSGARKKVTEQLGFTFQFDATRDVPWTRPGFDDSAWRHAAIPDFPEVKRRLRLTPLPEERPAPPAKVVQTGWLKRTGGATAAECVSSDYLQSRLPEDIVAGINVSENVFACGITLTKDRSALLRFEAPPDGTDGLYVIFDLGRETTGFLTFTVEAESGTVIDIAYGEHLDDGRVRARIQERNFADRYICCGGVNSFTHSLRRIAGRCIEMHFTNTRKSVVLHYAGMIPLELPLPEKPPFRSSDRLFDRVWQTAERTLRLCMHDHYEDCPWREQALYACDSRNQILYGYYRWGNYDFAAASIELLGKSLRSDGNLPIIAPTKRNDMLSIPSFTLAWISELYEYFLYSGQTALVEKFLPAADKIIDRALARRDGNSRLFLPPEGTKIWNFYEWSGNLSRLDVACQLPYNLLLREALLAAAFLHRNGGDSARADFLQSEAEFLGQNAEKSFRDDRRGGYRTSPEENNILDEYTQALMLCQDLVPDDMLPRLLENLGNKSMVPLTFSAMLCMVRGLMNAGGKGDELIWKYLSVYEPLVLSGATSLWETARGANDFRFAGSLCHGWSSVHVYWAGAGVLGIHPLEPGFRRFSVAPHPGHLDRAEGTVPTPKGDIRVSWSRERDGLIVAVDHPEELMLVFSAPETTVFKEISDNGKILERER